MSNGPLYILAFFHCQQNVSKTIEARALKHFEYIDSDK